ncbi:MAG: ATP-binding protein [Anaerolineales bacterium]
MSAEDTFNKISLLRLAFIELEDEELLEMAKLSRFHTYPAGHILCQEGAEEDVFYIIAEGSVIITQHLGEEQGERILRTGNKGDVIGEMALIQSAPRSASVRTTSTCTTLEMGKEDFETILNRSPHLAIEIVRITLDRIRANDRMAIKDLQKTNKVLRQLDRNKLDFIQVASHELRTPLTVLKGYVELLDSFPEVKTNAAIVDVLAGINKGTDRMHEVVNLMFDVTRMDVENLQVASVPVLVKQLVDSLAQDFENAAVKRKIKVITNHKDDTPGIHADPELIQKALYHLIINAIKYTPDGGQVTISTRPIKMDEDIPAVEIAVKDTGIGLDPEHHELVFEKFYQVGDVDIHSSGKTTFKGGGPGLGLAIVHGVAKAHGGKVWVESLGHDEVHFPGSTFYLQLPVNPSNGGNDTDPPNKKG